MSMRMGSYHSENIFYITITEIILYHCLVTLLLYNVNILHYPTVHLKEKGSKKHLLHMNLQHFMLAHSVLQMTFINKNDL